MAAHDLKKGDQLFFFKAGIIGWGKSREDMVKTAIEFLTKALQQEKFDCDEYGVLRAHADVAPMTEVVDSVVRSEN